MSSSNVERTPEYRIYVTEEPQEYTWEIMDEFTYEWIRRQHLIREEILRNQARSQLGRQLLEEIHGQDIPTEDLPDEDF